MHLCIVGIGSSGRLPARRLCSADGRVRVDHGGARPPALRARLATVHAHPPGSAAGLRVRITVPGRRLYTFTGGSGGAARTAPSAARTAADAYLAVPAAPRPGAPVPAPAYAVP